ncbi:hypothetical protein [Mucilaginibacter sp.]|uniref:hypothetical protein n=1 Tax=Mucilaginibacter sp. TaxID=1882438 RepID=UPI003D0A7473
MKKLIAIVFLSVQMFSICGHILLYKYFVYRSDKLFNEQISKNRYNVNDLVEIKVPVHTPSVQSWTGYEKINGQIQFKNTCYNYVKIKLTSDTIFLMCVPNYEKTRLFNQNIINARDIADIPINKKDHVPFGKLINLGNYSFPIVLYRFSSPVVLLKASMSCLHVKPINSYLPIFHQPPKAIC